MAFPPAFLEEVAAKNPIEEVVGQYVNLKRSGANMFGLCPFHGEKTASFSVAPEKGIYYCFGCHKGGSVINFQMEIEGLSYADAVRALAKRAGIPVPEDEQYQSRYRQQERLWALSREAARFFHEQLYSPVGAEGLQYARNRGLSQSTLTRFGIGFAPNSWSSLCDAMKQKGYTEEELKNAGLVSVSQKNGSIYDKFRNRLMFPIIDVRGNVIGFGGRVMDNSTPKYLNSPETIIFNKRKNLFALNVAKKTKLEYLILVEGYMDAIALHQYGFDCAVASLGTSLTEDHAVLLSRYTKQVMLIYDGDQAGQNATKRAIPMLEKVGLQVKVLQMRDAKDPDEFLKKYGADKFRILLEESSNRVEYQLRDIQNKYNLSLDEDKIRFISEAAELVSSLGNAAQREIYGGRAAQAAGISADTMSIEVKKAFKRRIARDRKKQEKVDLAPAQHRQPQSRTFHYDNIKSAIAEETVILCISRDPEMVQIARELRKEQFSSSMLGNAFDQIIQLHDHGLDFSAAALTGFSDDEMSHLVSILQREDTAVSETALKDAIKVIRQECQLQAAKSDDDQIMELRRKLLERKGYS